MVTFVVVAVIVSIIGLYWLGYRHGRATRRYRPSRPSSSPVTPHWSFFLPFLLWSHRDRGDAPEQDHPLHQHDTRSWYWNAQSGVWETGDGTYVENDVTAFPEEAPQASDSRDWGGGGDTGGGDTGGGDTGGGDTGGGDW
jgi:uncharacterized membrane protein YgcG